MFFSSLTLLGWGVWFAQPVWADAISLLPPERAVTLALSNNPEIRDIEAELQRSQAALARLRAPLFNPSGSVRSTPDQRRSGVNVSQPLSLTAQRRALREQAEADRQAATARLHRTRLSTAAAVRRAYSGAVVRVGVASLAEQNLSYIQQLERAAVLRYEEGEAALLDVRLARLSLAQATSWLLEARAVETQGLQALTAIIGASVTADAVITDPLAVAPLPALDTPQQRSDVVAAAAELRAAESFYAAQRAAALSPLSVGAFVFREDSEVFIGPSLSWTLPLFERNQEDRAAAGGARRVAEARFVINEAQVETEVVTNAARLAEAARLTEALGADLDQEAEAALAGIQLGYQAGQKDLLTTVLLQAQVIEGQVALIELSGQLADARLAWMLTTEDDRLLGETP